MKNYKTLKVKELERLVKDREIISKNSKADMIRQLELDDKGEYVRPTEINPVKGKKYRIGIDIKNQEDLRRISKLIEKNDAVRLNQYYNNRIWFETKKENF